jgi:hypothetical protein
VFGLDADLGYEDQESKARVQPPSAYLAYCALARRVAAMDAALRSEPVTNRRTPSILEEEIAAAMEVIQRYETTSLNL